MPFIAFSVSADVYVGGVVGTGKFMVEGGASCGNGMGAFWVNRFEICGNANSCGSALTMVVGSGGTGAMFRKSGTLNVGSGAVNK